MNRESYYIEVAGPDDQKEFYLTEWLDDHARTGWWAYGDCVREFGSKDKNEWHCMLKEERIKTRLKVTVVDLQSEVERLQGENEKLKNYLFQHLQYLKSTNVFHTHQSEINAIEKILNVLKQ